MSLRKAYGARREQTTSHRPTDLPSKGRHTGLHVAVGRDLNPDGSADVLATQLEEIVE